LAVTAKHSQLEDSR